MIAFQCGECRHEFKAKIGAQKHIKNTHMFTDVKIHKISRDGDETLYLCDKCGKGFSKVKILIVHVENESCTITKPAKLVKTHTNDVDLLIKNAVLKEKIKHHKELQKCHEQLMQEKDKTINILKNSNKSILKSNDATISIINYLTRNFDNAPAMKTLTDYSYLHKNNEKYSLGKILLTYHSNNQLSHNLAKLIENNYKKEDKSTQSLWSSDVSRLNYVVRAESGAKRIDWMSDKCGVHVMEVIIGPIIERCKIEIKLYLKRLDKTSKKLAGIIDSDSDDEEEFADHNGANCNNIEEYRNYLISEMNKAHLTSCDLKNGSVASEILKKIAPMMQFNRKLCIENID
jgi:hypothetical protein